MKFCPSCNNTFEEQLVFCPRDGETLLAAPENIVGCVLDGKYEVESFIAQGGMGAVYRARHILLGDRVVIKTMHSDLRNNSRWVRRFQQEGRAARSFSHPNAVTVYDLSTADDGLIYLVMEYVEGHTLARELKKRGRFTPAEAIAVLAPVADVLDAAHARGVVHRDLKPENVMIGETDDGRRSVKVLDLGIAKLMEMPDAPGGEMPSLTVTGQILGTPYYMSPEQWGIPARDGDPEVDARTDIYSLGVMFFELVAGRKPFAGSTLAELGPQHVEAERPLLHKISEDVPEAFGLAVARAMAKDRGDRQQSAGQLIGELRAALGSTSNASAPATDTEAKTLIAGAKLPASGAGKAAAVAAGRRSNAPLIIGVALVLLLLAGVGIWLARSRAKTSDEQGVKTEATPSPTNSVPVMKPVLSYWIESFDQPAKGETKRVAGEQVVPLVSGQRYKFYFKPAERGYLYVVGQKSDGNAFMTFLTAMGDNNRESNLAVPNADFDLPYQGRLLLDKNSGTDEFIVIFSPTPLLAPAFLTEKYRRLTPSEVKELDDFRAKHRIGGMTRSVQKGSDDEAVVVSVPDGQQNQPIIFDILIKH